MSGCIADKRLVRKYALLSSVAVCLTVAVVFGSWHVSAQSDGLPLSPSSALAWQSQDYFIVEGRSAGAAITVGGTVVPAHEVTLTSQLSGQVIYLGGREGDRFDGSTVLVEIQADELHAKRRAALAQLDVARADIRNADIQFERELFSPRSRSLSQSGGMGVPSLFDQFFTRPFSDTLPGDIGGDPYLDRRADLYVARTAREQARARFRQIEHQIDEIDAYLDDSMIFTPFPGIILERMIEEGDTVYPGTPLMRYANDNDLEIEAQIPAGLVADLRVDQVVIATLSHGSTFNVQVSKVFPVANARLRTVTVKFRLPRGTRALPGTYAELLLDSGDDDAVQLPVIPMSAIRFNGSLPTVRVLDGGEKPSLRMIRLGEQQADGSVLVLSGLSIGERVLTVH